MKKYESYKDSGVEWLGEIPMDWKVTKLKFIGDAIGGLTYAPNNVVENADEGVLVLRSSNIQNGKLSLKDNVFVNLEISDKLTLKKGDILICSRNGSQHLIGKNICIDERTEGSTFGAFMMIFRSKYYGFLNQYFNSPIFTSQSGLFLTATINQLTSGTLNNFYIAIPESIEEQTQIANFLDHKTTQINTLISKKEQCISLLQEERIAIINQAVTKGLDPKVKMKDSGIEWLGEIPDHWKITRLNQIIKVKDGTHESPLQISKSETTFPLITSKDFKNGEINFENAKYISKEDHKNIIKRSNTEKGDIIMSMIGGNIGNLVYIQTDREFSIKNVCLFKTSFNTIYAKHLYYILKSPLLKIQIDLCSRGGAQGFLSLGDLRSLVYFVLPEKEIKSIVLHIENKEIRIEQLISKTQQEIELLKEYKTALISEVVTGKVDVRDLVN